MLAVASLVTNQSRYGSIYLQERKAFYAAESGAEYALGALSDSAGWREGASNVPVGDAKFNVTLDDKTTMPSLGDTIQVTSQGSLGMTKRTITIRLLSGGGLPKMFEYPLAADGDINLKDNIKVLDDNNGLNANVHTNGNMKINPPAYIEGFGSYGTLNGPTSVFHPNQNPDSLPVASVAPPVEIPLFNADDYFDIATNVTNGDLQITSDITLGTEENPVIWYVDGALDINSNTTISGYGAFIVTGDINLKNNITIALSGSPTSTVGIFTEGQVKFNDNITVEGQIYANGKVNFKNNCTVYGSVVSGAGVKFNGSVTVYYRPANSSLTQPFWGGGSSLKIVSWQN